MQEPAHLAPLEHPSADSGAPAYSGPERRRRGVVNAVRRATFGQRGWSRVLRGIVAVGVVTVGSIAGATQFGARASAAQKGAPASPPVGFPVVIPFPTTTTTAPPAPPTTTTTAPPARPSAPSAAPTPSSTPTPSAPPASAPSPAPAAAPAPAPAPAPSSSDPQAMGQAALALVRYPWQRIPGYSIQFLPISDAPQPGFYGNTTFTWGQPGGVSTLYVFPGESVSELAGITAFEIGHEVDAAGVEPGGGHTAIENALGIHPASWAPNCDCAEQNFLSGWYAAAFSAYWSPGVGNWSAIAPMPSGATLAAVQQWFDPAIA